MKALWAHLVLIALLVHTPQSYHTSRRLLDEISECGATEAAEEDLWFLRPQPSPLSRVLRATDASGRDVWTCKESGMVLPDPIIVLGTDGSGTRVLAKLLAKSGVRMLVERGVYGQMDVDGSRNHLHFTGVIQGVLGATHSTAYSLQRGVEAERKESSIPHLSEDSQAAVAARKLAKEFGAFMRANACESFRSNPPKVWGFKKPDLLDLVPFLREAFPSSQVRLNTSLGRCTHGDTMKTTHAHTHIHAHGRVDALTSPSTWT